MIKLIGYWRENRTDPVASVAPHLRPYLDKTLWQPDTSNDKYPDPRGLIDPDFWKWNGLKTKTIEYLKSGTPCNHYRGFSSCRICNRILGTFERTDGVWAWPDMLEHYVQSHDVRLPEEFLINVKTNSFFPKLEQHPIIKLDETFWINWRKPK